MKLTICLGTRGRPALLVPTLEKTVAMLAQLQQQMAATQQMLQQQQAAFNLLQSQLLQQLQPQ